jgi:transposase
MLTPNDFDEIYLYRPYADFRKGVDGLSGIVTGEMELNPFKSYLFVFCNTGQDKLKALYWDRSGFALWYKRLEEQKWKWPRHADSDSFKVKKEDLEKFLRGLNPWQAEHQSLKYDYA